MNTIHPILSRLALSAAAEALTARAAYYAGPTLGGPAALDALSLAEEARHALADAAARAATPERAVELLENAAASYLRSDAPAEHRAGLVRLAQAATEAARRVREATAEPAPLLFHIVPSFQHEPDPPVGPEVQGWDGSGSAVPPVVIDSGGVTGRVLAALRTELAAARVLAERLAAGTTHPDADTELGEARGRVLGLERALAVLGAKP